MSSLRVQSYGPVWGFTGHIVAPESRVLLVSLKLKPRLSLLDLRICHDSRHTSTPDCRRTTRP